MSDEIYSIYTYLTMIKFDPIAYSLGPFQITWYALSYIVGIIFSWRYFTFLSKKKFKIITHEVIETFFNYSIIGVIIGGRMGYVIFYNFEYYFSNPISILYIWEGGMSFHGGLLGVIFAQLLTSKKFNVPFFTICDITSISVPFGLMLGRTANFINGELYGRITNHPVGILFPNGGPLYRHPSQLYEAAFEGLFLFVIINLIAHLTPAINRTGFLTGIFISWYSISRFFIEFFREPDFHIGYVWLNLSLGQLLCLPMIVIGILILFFSSSKLIWPLKV